MGSAYPDAFVSGYFIWDKNMIINLTKTEITKILSIINMKSYLPDNKLEYIIKYLEDILEANDHTIEFKQLRKDDVMAEFHY